MGKTPPSSTNHHNKNLWRRSSAYCARRRIWRRGSSSSKGMGRGKVKIWLLRSPRWWIIARRTALVLESLSIQLTAGAAGWVLAWPRMMPSIWPAPSQPPFSHVWKKINEAIDRIYPNSTPSRSGRKLGEPKSTNWASTLSARCFMRKHPQLSQSEPPHLSACVSATASRNSHHSRISRVQATS